MKLKYIAIDLNPSLICSFVLKLIGTNVIIDLAFDKEVRKSLKWVYKKLIMGKEC